MKSRQIVKASSFFSYLWFSQ